MKRLLVLIAIATAMLATSIASAADSTVDALTACQNPGDRVLITGLDVVRKSGSPHRETKSFAAAGPEGLVCIQNHAATSGGVSLNGSSIAAPSDFAGAPVLIGRYVALQSDNTLIATASGARGQGFSVYVYYARGPSD